MSNVKVNLEIRQETGSTSKDTAIRVKGLRKVATIVACLAVTSIMFSGCKKDDPVNNLPTVDEEGLTEDIRNIIPDEYVETLKDLGFQVNGGNTPPNVEGYYLANPLELVDRNFSENVASHKDMYLTFYEQNNKKLTVKINYNVWADHGLGVTSTMEVNGLGSFIVGEGKKFTIFAESIRTDGNSTAKTVEAFSGEITENGIKNYQWAIIMIDRGDGNGGKWIENGQAYVKKDSDGLAKRINSLTLPDNNKYHKGIAETAAVYAMLAYENSRIKGSSDPYPGWLLFNNPSTNLMIYSGKKGDNTAYSNTEPTLLKKQLELDEYNSVKSGNYGDNDRHNISYTFAKRELNSNEVLFVVILRGTDGVEWYGNMEVGYDSRHGDFELANKSLQNEIKTYINNNCNGKKINFFITGHSRGASVGNLLAADITSGLFSYSNIGKVFGYFFATPNNTTETNAEGKYSNIFNFCFSDDFVPQVPLVVWEYKKYGVTFSGSAQNSYSQGGTFKTMMDEYVAKSTNRLPNGQAPKFEKDKVNEIIQDIFPNAASSVYEYYNTTHTAGGTNMTTYYFMHDIIAPAAAESNFTNLAVINVPNNLEKIKEFFVFNFNAINDTHSAFTYWIALKCNKFDMKGYVDGGGDLVE